MIIPKEFLKTIKRSGLGFAAFAELRYENPDVVATSGDPAVAKDRADFVLNQSPWGNGATSILVAGDNFGCGSSREHAPWSILDMGIKCIISAWRGALRCLLVPLLLPRPLPAAAATTTSTTLLLLLLYSCRARVLPPLLLPRRLPRVPHYYCYYYSTRTNQRRPSGTSFADIFYNNCFKNGMLPIVLERPAVEDFLAAAAAGEDLTVDLEAQTVCRANGEGECHTFDIDPFRKNNLLNGFDEIGLTLQKAPEIDAFETERSKSFPWLDGATTRVPASMPVVQVA